MKTGRPSIEDAPATMVKHGKRWIQVAKAAEMLGVTRGRIYHLIWQKRIRCIEEDRAGWPLKYVSADDVASYAEYQKQREAGSREMVATA